MRLIWRVILYVFLGFWTVVPLGQRAWAETAFSCPTYETIVRSFELGLPKEWPNYTEGPGARVQRQHPKTFLLGQAKHVERQGSSFMICQYSNHIGWVFMFGQHGWQKGQVEGSLFWREDYTESEASSDKLGEEFISVCMDRRGDLEVMSTGCSFTKKIE